MSLSSCRQGLKVERNKLVPIACICIIIVVIDIIMAIQHFSHITLLVKNISLKIINIR